jgi:hypothetical protein
MNLKGNVPNDKWLVFQNQIILGDFSDDYIEYIKDLKFDCFSKIDGTNTKIAYFPSTKEIFIGGKTDNADIEHTGQRTFLEPVCERIKPILEEMFPPECAKFTPKVNDKNQIQYYEKFNDGNGITYIPLEKIDCVDVYSVEVEEQPIYIYGEFCGKKIQAAGGNYDKTGNRFYVFDICQQGWYIPINMLNDYCNKLGLEVVPYIGQMTISEAEETVRNGFKTRVPNASNPDFIEEGIVARPVIPIKDPRGRRIIVKIKHSDYNKLQSAINTVGEEEYIKFLTWYKENKDKLENGNI